MMAYEIKKITGQIPDYPLEGTDWYKKGYYFVSPHNIGLTDLGNAPDFVAIHDVTLRDGEQTPGVTFTEDERVYIGELLNDLGVSRIEAGMPIVSDAQFNAMKRMSKLGFRSELYGFARAVPKDVELVSQAGADGIVIEHCVCPRKCRYGYHLTPEALVERIAGAAKRAHELGLKTVFMGWDWFRAPLEFTLWLIDAVLQETSLDGLTIVDTVGSTLPDAVEAMFRIFHEKFPDLTLEFHGHNDFGVGVACALSAVKGGASVVHTAMNALGERTGNTATEEVVGCLEILRRIPTGVNMSLIDKTAQVISEISKVPIPAGKPFLGERNYIVESGVATHLELSMGEHATDPMSGTITPLVIGRQPGERIRLGKNSGRASVELILQKHGLEYDDALVSVLLQDVKKQAMLTKAIVSEEAFLDMARSRIGNRS